MRSIGKYLLEVLIIVISILSAFWLEQYRDDLKDEKDVKEALKVLQGEIGENRQSLSENYIFFREMSVSMDLFFRTEDGLLRLSASSADSILSMGLTSLELELIECDEKGMCIYEARFRGIDYIPEIPIKRNVWNSINNSQLASKFSIQLLAVADQFYNSWSHERLQDLIIEYNSTFIGESGALDVLPSPTMFYRLRTFHEISLNTYDQNLPKFESMIRDLE